MENIILSPISIDELETRIVNRLKTVVLPANPQPAKESEDEFLTVKQVATLLGVSLVTIHTWKREGKIKFHRFGSRIRFRKSDIINAQKFSPVAKHK